MTTGPVAVPLRLGAVTVALGASLLLAACGSATPLRYYTVESVPAARPALPYHGPAVQIRELRIPASMDRPELIDERPGGEVRLREFDRWAAPLERSARQALTQSLAERLPAGSVVFAGAARPADRIELSVEVLAMRVADGDASMWVAWGTHRQYAAAGNAVNAAPSRELRLRAPAEPGAQATVQAWSTLLGQLADRVAAELAAGP